MTVDLGADMGCRKSHADAGDAGWGLSGSRRRYVDFRMRYGPELQPGATSLL
ncbi:hypothetical protein HanXRQr2_Chr15g0690381 [Helianthus annuus]|uniref:Uncharacterized protein n=1 Tax=Helianthus annuus TaxID=4232 RepID=A0A9K3H330_HELAN|nr:hypothetical protein HanXRQr2_Chr15g0690381 [Helianthus annuus]KAJ0831023.1 hypothetical protein HanPSC8_Chr15g0662241 [Helianthus annuus]